LFLKWGQILYCENFKVFIDIFLQILLLRITARNIAKFILRVEVEINKNIKVNYFRNSS